jgi:hypothetical protein
MQGEVSHKRWQMQPAAAWALVVTELEPMIRANGVDGTRSQGATVVVGVGRDGATLSTHSRFQKNQEVEV